MLDKHYEELTPYITLDGKSVFANSMPLDLMFLDKKFKKLLRKSEIEVSGYMNVMFEKRQAFKDEVLKWKLRDDVTEVVLIEEKQLFVKGKHFWAYCVGIL